MTSLTIADIAYILKNRADGKYNKFIIIILRLLNFKKLFYYSTLSIVISLFEHNISATKYTFNLTINEFVGFKSRYSANFLLNLIQKICNRQCKQRSLFLNDFSTSYLIA